MDMGEAADGRSDVLMDMAMGMPTAVTSITAKTPGGTRFEPMERNESRKRRRRSEAPVTPSNWKSRMERTMRQQTQEVTQLHQTVGHLMNLLQVQAARKEAQWLVMMTWMQEREQNWVTHHEDDKLLAARIPNIIAKTMKGVPQGLERREKEREITATTDGGMLEAS